MKALQNLFATSRSTKQTVPARKVQKPRMEVESLSDRIMPAITSSLNFTTGVLAINGDAANDNVKIFKSLMPGSFTQSAFWVQDLTRSTNNISFYNVANVREIQFNGNAGNDTVNASTVDVPMRLLGGDGNDTLNGGVRNDWFDGGNGYDILRGGPGDDYFRGSAGNDDYFGDDGADLVFRNGQNPTFNGGNGDDVVLGLNAAMTNSNIRLTERDLSQSGDMTAALSGNLVTITGPSGIGLQLIGSWRTERDRIISTGNVIMKTAIGDMTVASASTPITIELTPMRYRGLLSDVPGYASHDSYGTVKQVLWTGLPLNTSTGPFSDFATRTGINMNISTPGLKWGLAMGDDLGSYLAPLNPAVPYFFASAGTDFMVNYGGVGYGPSISGGTNYLTVIADLNDPFIYAKVGNFGIAGSLKGYIPFDPWAAPDYQQNKIYGNLYGTGAVTLGGLPINLSGNAVLDLDANNDGVWVGVSNQTWQQVMSNPISSVSAIMTDIAFGVNGNVELGYELAGFNIGIPLANASVMYNRGDISFRGATPDPFKDTVMASYMPQVNFDVQGMIRNFGRDWNLEAHAGVASFAGLSSQSLDVTLNNNGVTVDAQVTALAGIGQMKVKGWISSTGDFGLVGNARFQMDIGIGEVLATANVSFVRQNGVISFNAGMSARLEIGSDDWNIFGDLNFQVSARLSSTGFQFSGSGRAEIGVTLAGDEHSFDLGFNINNRGFSIDIPLIEDDLVVRW